MPISDYLFDVLNEKADSAILIKWILGDLSENVLPEIQRSDFALYFLNYLQDQTSSLIESCPLNRKETEDCILINSIKNSSDSRESKSHSNARKVTKQTPGHVRKILTSPGDGAATHSLKKVTPQPLDQIPHNQFQRNEFPPSASFPGPKAQYNSMCLNFSTPNLYDPRLGYTVPYYGDRNCYYNYPNYQFVSVSSVCNQILSNNITGSNYSPNRNMNPPNMMSPQTPNSNNFSTSSSSNYVSNPSISSSPLSPQKNNRLPQSPKTPRTPKTPQTPKTPLFNRVEPETPNSNSSCSSGVALMSPESPLYSENFPAMGSNERRNNRRENTRNSSEPTNNEQLKKNSYSRKRIKPTTLNKTTGNNGLQGEFGKRISGDLYDNTVGKFPERKQNFFEEKVLPNCDLMKDKLEESDVTSPISEKSAIETSSDLSNCLPCDSNNISSINNEDINYFQIPSEKNEDKSEEFVPLSKQIKRNSSAEKKCDKGKMSVTPDPLKVHYKNFLTKLAEIYSALLDANLIPNITAEMYFIFSLLTVDTMYKKRLKSNLNKCDSSESFTENLCDKTLALSLLSNDQNESPKKSTAVNSTMIVKDLKSYGDLERVEANNKLYLFDTISQCVYFACEVLSRQKHFLAVLDKTTLKLLMENKRLSSFVPETVKCLKNLYDKKDIEFKCKQRIEWKGEGDGININPVPFQMELDNRDTFSSDPSFHIFRKQRDALYEILQIWNEKHDKREWNFNLLSSKIEKLFLMSTDSVNMRHLARHFCDLLLKTVSTKENETEELSVSGLPKIDKSKLNRLTERLVRPSSSGLKDPRPSPDFPGLQSFYHDFLVIPAANYMFHMHVINCLVERIHLLNGTSFQFEEPDFDGQIVQEETRLAFLKCLQSLCLLAKFLGLVVFRPYHSSSELPQSVLQDEISTRNKILPPLDLQQYLVVAENEGRLVQTIPWIVEYLGMMDSAAQFLTSYRTVLTALLSLYLRTAPHLFPMIYIEDSGCEMSLMTEPIHSCSVSSADDSDINKSENSITKVKSKLSWQTALLLRLSVGWLFDTSNFSQSLFFNMASSFREHPQKEQAEEKWCNMTIDRSDIVDEKLLREFCPYLINLKVCLAESRNSSRQGPVRHVTPIPSQQTALPKHLAAAALELQLEENFFMGQSESLRRTVDFAAERAASACIKNICSNVVVGLKSDVLKLKETKRLIDLQPYIEKYNKRVEEEIENVIKQRLTIALSALLGPDVIEQSLNNICQQIAARKLRERVVNWLQSHINVSEILTKLQLDGIGQSDANNSSQNRNENVPNNCPSFSEALIMVQDLLNDVLDSRGNSGIKSSSEIVDIFKSLSATLSFYCDSSSNMKLLLSLVLDYVLLVVTYRPNEVTSSVLEEFCMLWKFYNHPGPLSRLLSPRNMMLLAQGGQTNSTLTWEKFGCIIVSSLTHDLMSISDLEFQAVAFFRHSWPNDVLLSMSKCLTGILEDVRRHPACVDDPKFVLMLELCSDMAADLSNSFDELDF